jgi:hypothetical protein
LAQLTVSPDSEKQDLLGRLLVGISPKDVRYAVLAAHLNYLSGGGYHTAAAFRRLLRQLRRKNTDNRSLINELAEAAFCMGEFDALASLLSSKYAVPVRIVLHRSQESDNPSIVLWSVERSDPLTFAFSENFREHPYADLLLKNWVQVLPLFVSVVRFNHPQSGRLWINLGDMGDIPGLAFCDHREDYHLVPDPAFMQTAAYADVKAAYASPWVPWSSREPVAFWRGQTTGWYSVQGTLVRSWRDLPRIQLCQLARTDPAQGLVDAALTGLAQIVAAEDQEQIRNAGLLGEHVDWRAFQRYRFQIDIDGNTNAWSSTFIKLCSGSPVLKVSSPLGFKQWYYDRLIPWENYVPVEADMSDLLEKIAWLRQYDDRARQIGDRARRLALMMSEPSETYNAMQTILRALKPAIKRRTWVRELLSRRCHEPADSGPAIPGSSDADGQEADGTMRTFEGLGDAQVESKAFSSRVLELSADSQPVKLHLGPGLVPKPGFVNIDKFKMDEVGEFFGENPKDYIVFPFAEARWPIPDCTVDYIYHEDFFEHIPQKNQFLVLAEALRVLKPGGIHRISTPCLVQSMRAHSDFTLGFAGVHVFEWERWGHVALVSRASLEEMALLVGYKCVYFTEKSKSMSPFASADSRPHGDRDQVLGNIFADLLK